ncbi:hypothetical protein M8818_000727 [Zalaria obscura]|uniref:Uncharacterized protein n=1 Tax=Zalaria obscura TaxID=2024903 RepID=A0ACC3SQW9_9PEZI
MGFEVGLSALFLACASLISSSGLATSLAFGTLSTQPSFALDRPVHAAIPILASLGAAVLGLDRALNRFAAGANVSQKYAAALVPFLLAVVDFVMVRRHERHPLDDAEGSSLYDAVEKRVMRSLYRYLIPTAMLSFSGVVLSRTSIGPTSTYICPAISSSRTWIPALQHLELPLDFCIAICVDLLINITPPSFGVKRHSAVGWIFLISAFLVGIAGFLYYTLVSDDRLWISKIPPGFVWSLVRLDMLACFIAVSALLAVSSAGIMTATVVATFTISCVKATQWAWNNIHSFPPLSTKIQHKDYLKEASASANLTAAVNNYHARYQRAPPPGFSKWYDYASSRNAVIIDDFDGLNKDMLPFWSLSPAEIRQRTWQVISNPWNDVAGISIRNGKAEISPNVVPTHRWMLDGIIGIMDKFGQELPDMDLGFNLNDECRIAVPFEDIEPMREVGRRSGNTGSTLRDGFSSDRGRQWLPIPEEPNPDRPFREMSFQRTFYDFGSLGCSPGSPARTQRHWDEQSPVAERFTDART